MGCGPVTRSPLVVTGVGLATAVGSSARATAAALWAGVSRFAEIPDLLLPSQTGPSPALAARSPLSPPHASGADRGARLVAAALADALTAATPQSWRLEAGAGSEVGALRRLLPPELAQVAVPGPDLGGGLCHGGTLAALAQLAAAAPSRPTALVAVDSLAVDPALAHFAQLGRVKSAPTPGGFVPGEAAGVLVVETEDAAREAGRAVLAVVEAWGQGAEPIALEGPTPSRAEGLTTALATAVAGLLPNAAIDLAVLDLNGERSRAAEWALAAPRALPFWEGRLPTWTPADGVGDCGVATGALLLVCASLALARGPAGARALVATSDDAGARWAVILRAPDRPPPPGVS